MNIYIAWLFRLIPLIMGLICLFIGLDVLSLSIKPQYFVSGHVLISLSAICIALFTTASVIIQQLTNRFNCFWMYIWPLIGYLTAICTIIWGLSLIFEYNGRADYFIAGHVIFGVGLIASCVSTVAASSSYFVYIPKNSQQENNNNIPKEVYSSSIGLLFIAIPTICTIIGFAWVILLFINLNNDNYVMNYTAAHVLAGLSSICACLIGLVVTVVKQTRNTFSKKEHWFWSFWVCFFAIITVIWGGLVLICSDKSYRLAPGIIMICLGMICFSILSKVWLLALVWHRGCSLSNRIPIIPITTCLFCLFFSSFIVQIAQTNINYFIPSRVLVGLGAVCFTLFSIVSILETGTSKIKYK